MKCPHCDYEHRPEPTWDDVKSEYLYDEVFGRKGAFYKMPVKLERIRHKNEYDYDSDPVYLHACPSCMKTFVE